MDNNRKDKMLTVVAGFCGILLSLIVAWFLYIFTWQELGDVMSVIFAVAVFGLGALLSLVGVFCVSAHGDLSERVRRIEEAVLKTKPEDFSDEDFG